MTDHALARIEDLYWLAETGAPLDDALARLGMTYDTAEKFCERYGVYPALQRLKHRSHVCTAQCPSILPPLPPLPIQEPTMTDDTTTDLIAQGQEHSSKRIQAAAKRADEALEKLRDLFAAEQAKAEAQAEIDQLERQLREAKARARGQAVTSPATAVARVDTKKIRAWAHEHGVHCPDRGRVPKRVVEAYDQAHRRAS